MHLRWQPARTVNRCNHCDLHILLPNFYPDCMNRRILSVLPPDMENAIFHIRDGNLMIGFDPFARSLLVDSRSIVDIKTSGSTKLIIPALRMLCSSLSRTQRRTSPTLFGNFFRSFSHDLIIKYRFLTISFLASGRSILGLLNQLLIA